MVLSYVPLSLGTVHTTMLGGWEWVLRTIQNYYSSYPQVPFLNQAGLLYFFSRGGHPLSAAPQLSHLSPFRVCFSPLPALTPANKLKSVLVGGSLE